MTFNPNDKKIKEISKELSSLSTEDQRFLFLSAFFASKNVSYRAKIARDGEKVNVSLATRKDKPLSEKEIGVACFQSAASFLTEASRRLQVPILDLLSYLGLFTEGISVEEKDK